MSSLDLMMIVLKVCYIGRFSCYFSVPLMTVKKDKNSWSRERNQLVTNNTDLKEISDQLRNNNAELRQEIEELQMKLCGK